MSYAFVNEAGNDSAASSTTVSVTYSPTAGNLLVFGVTVGGDGSGGPTITMSDGVVGNTFAPIGSAVNSAAAQRNAYFYAANCKGGSTTFTATFGSSQPFNALYVGEYSGIATASPFLNGVTNENASPGTTANAVTSTVANATSQPALVWGFCIDANGNSWPAAGTGFTGRGAMWSTATCTSRGEDKRVTVTGNVAATFTAGTGTDDFVTGVGIFLESGAVAFLPLGAQILT